MAERRYWIAVASRELVVRAQAGGYAEMQSGRAGPLERFAEGDGFLYYSPREADPSGPRLQAFTAVGRVATDDLTRVAEVPGRPAFRRTIDFRSSTPAPIHPLLDSLTFIRDRRHWGAAFRFGTLRIPAEDFHRIASAMGCPDPIGER